MPDVPAAPSDWGPFYTDLVQRAAIPWAAAQDYQASRVVVRDLYVDLDRVYGQIRAGGLSPRTVSIYADTARLSAASEIVLRGSALLLAARQVIADGPTRVFLDARGGAGARFALYTDGVRGQLTGRVVSADSSRDFDLSAVGRPGAVLELTPSGAVLVRPQPLGDAGLGAGSPGRALVRSALQCAIALFDTDPATARAMLQWILNLTEGSPRTADLRLQSGALLAQLDAAALQVTFVPYLDKDVYLKVTEGYLGSAQAYETQYARFTDRQQEAAARRDAAQLMLSHYDELAGLNDQLVRQGEDNLRGAQAAELQARASLQIQQSQVDEAQISFKYEAKIWAREQIMKAVLSMVVAIGKVAAGVALMAVGDEAAAPGTAAAAAEGAKAAADVAEVAKSAEDLGTISKLMSDIADLMGKLKKAGEALPKIFAAVNEIVVAAGSVSDAASLSSLTEAPSGDIAAQADWDAFRLDAVAFLKPAVDADVPGAEEYQIALEKLCIYGKAYMASQAGMVRAGQALSRVLLQRQLARNDQKRLEDAVARLSDDADLLGELAQSFYQRELDIRTWFYIALQNYVWAFRYWALRPSRVRPSMTKPAVDLQADMAAVTQEWAEVLASFNPPPAPFNIPVLIEDRQDGLYAGAVQAMRANGAVRVPIPLDSGRFATLGRVRVDRVRAWLQGVGASDQRPVTVQIATAGQYDDRLGADVFHFAASPAHRQFQYTGPVGDAAGIRVDGTPARREQDAYFLPTAFTDWILVADPAQNPGVDLGPLSGIRLEFAGEGLPRI